MRRAYELESTIARFPRVVISKEVMGDINRKGTGLFSEEKRKFDPFNEQADDGPYYVHVLRKITAEIQSVQFGKPEQAARGTDTACRIRANAGPDSKTRKSPRRDFRVQIGRAGDLTCVMATPEIASSPPTINFGVIRSPRNNTLEIKANTGSSRPNGATRSMEQWAISQNQRPNPTIPPMKIGECQPTAFIRRDKARQLPMFKE
jgi:hypothetical protein